MYFRVVPCGNYTAYMAPQGCTSINAQNRFPDHMFGVDNTSNSLGWPSINMLACPEHRDIDVTMWIAPSMALGAWRRGASAVPALSPYLARLVTCLESATYHKAWDIYLGTMPFFQLV